MKLSAVRGTCSHCGQKLPVAHKHTMTKGLVSCLWKLFYAGGPARLSEIGLSTTEFANFQKLHYFGLIAHAAGSRAHWILTNDGADFLRNQLSVPNAVWTKNGKVVERSTKRVFIIQVDENWKWPEDYAREAKLA
jgi:hypothetical protein